jgi:hypothetical protein
VKLKLTPVRQVVLVVILVTGGWWLYDLNDSDTVVLHWKESVTLASGQSVQIKRHVKFHQNYMWGVRMMSAQDYVEASIEMDSTQKDFVRWEAPIQPLYLDRDPNNGEWIIVSGEDANYLWPVNGQPCPPQWAFRLHGGIWYLQPVPTNLLGRRANLLLDLRRTDDHILSRMGFTLSRMGFERAVIQRKDDQFKQRDRVSVKLESVGASYNMNGYCKGSDTPRFTREFIPKASNHPNIANFPRLSP